MRITTFRCLLISFAVAVAVGCASNPKFQDLDENGDGNLSRGEAGDWVRDFDTYDCNGDGRLNAEEYRQARVAVQLRRDIKLSPDPSNRTGGGGFGS